MGRDRAKNGLDDDRNGFVDDVHGWNFVADSNDLNDKHGHGTHIAGIVKGVAPKVSVMVLKYFDPSSTGQQALANTVKAIRYAIKMKANIINYSGGGIQPSAVEEAAIKEAAVQGILVVAAAGNEHSNSDQRHYYPADYQLPNILSVTAIDSSRRVLPTSNYGERTVHLAAPGADILSALPGGAYGLMTGTSQATAFATGVAALLIDHNLEMRSPERIIAHLMRTGTPEPRLNGKTMARSVLNSYRALAMQERGVAASGVTAANELGIEQKMFIDSPQSRSKPRRPSSTSPMNPKGIQNSRESARSP
jgi:subtilisin family serine protease